MNSIKWGTIALVILVIGFAPTTWQSHDLVIGSKKFTESVILGEMVRISAESESISAIHYRELGGTQLVFQGLKAGEIDIYPEYTGTLAFEILQLEAWDEAVAEMRLAEWGLAMSKPLGFNNSYALGMKRDQADRLGISKISDLANHPQLACRFGNEFIERADGWKPLKAHYGLSQQDVLGVDHDVAFRQLDAGTADVIDVYMTESKIKLYDVKVLEDDRDFFPRYDSILLFRQEWAERSSRHSALIARFEDCLNDQKMLALNTEAALEKQPEAVVAAGFLEEKFSIQVLEQEKTFWERLAMNAVGHLNLVRSSLVAALLFAIPLGVLAARDPKLGGAILAVVGVLQTIPGLALLVLLIAPVEFLQLSSFGSGSVPVLVALFVYSLLPIVTNTHAGLTGISPQLKDSAAAMGLSSTSRLFRIELPLASPMIMAGIKTAAVINVGFATLGALIGAPGFGQPIFAGIRLADNALILEGAVPAAAMAVLVQVLFNSLERFVVPKGLRL